MDSVRDTFDRAVAALVASTADQDVSQVLSIIEARTEAKISTLDESLFEFTTKNASRYRVTHLLNYALETLVTRVPNDEDENLNVTRYGLLLEHVGKILKSHRHEEIINTCLRLVANLCRDNEQFAEEVVMNENNLNIIESIVRVLRLVLEKNVPSKTTLMLSLSSLHNILINSHPPQNIIDDYGIVKALGYAIVKFIDDWKTSEGNHDALTMVMLVLELLSEFECKNISFELKNTGGGDAMLLLSDLIVMPVVSEPVTIIVLNLHRYCIHDSHVPFDDMYGKMIEKLQDLNVYTDDDELYELFLQNFCLLLNAQRIPKNLIVTATVILLNVLQSHVRPTEASFKNCQWIITTLQQYQFECCLRLMLDSGILSILSTKLDWIFGVENQLDLHHNEYKYGYETDDNDDLDEFSADKNVPKRELASKIVNLIECFANLKPAALELGTSDIVYKLLLFYLPKNKSFKPPDLMSTITNIITKPEHLINLLKQTQFFYTTYKLLLPMHHSRCVRCIDLFIVGHMIMTDLTKVVEDTIEQGDIAHSLYTASPTVKETLVVALPFFSEKMSTLNNLMITCGGLDVLIDAFRQENPQRGFIICSLQVLAQKIEIKGPIDCTGNFDFDDNNNKVAIVLNLKNYRPGAGHLVAFKLDDDSCLQADRELLASKSDFFNRLLFGQFKESHEKVIRLSETPHVSFKLVLTLLQLDDIATGNKLCRNGGKLLKRINLAVVLEAIVLCDRFLLKELYMSLTLYMQHCKFSSTSVPIIYRQLVDSPAHILRMEIIAYCLVGYMSEKKRNCLFEELLRSEYSEQFVDDIKNVFRKFLCASRD